MPNFFSTYFPSSLLGPSNSILFNDPSKREHLYSVITTFSRRLVWHAVTWSGLLFTGSLLRSRLLSSMATSQADRFASDLIVRHFEACWEESIMMYRQLAGGDVRVKIEGLFPVEKLMAEIEECQEKGQLYQNDAEEIELIKQKKIQGWEKLKYEVLARLLTLLYTHLILKSFLSIAMAIIGRNLYLHTILGPHCFISSSDVSSTNRLLISVPLKFIQSGLPILVESLRNATRGVLSRLELREPITKGVWQLIIEQIRHEIESSVGRNVLEDCLWENGSMDELLFMGTGGLSASDSHLIPEKEKKIDHFNDNNNIREGMSWTRKKLLIGMMATCRKWMNTDRVKTLIQTELERRLDSIGKTINSNHSMIISSQSQQSQSNVSDNDNLSLTPSIPLIKLIPRISKAYHEECQQVNASTNITIFEQEMRQLAAIIYVDEDKDITFIFRESVLPL